MKETAQAYLGCLRVPKSALAIPKVLPSLGVFLQWGGGNEAWDFGSPATRVLPARCLSVLRKVVGVYLREEQLSQTSCF